MMKMTYSILFAAMALSSDAEAKGDKTTQKRR